MQIIRCRGYRVTICSDAERRIDGYRNPKTVVIRFCSLRSPDRKQVKIGRSCPTEGRRSASPTARHRTFAGNRDREVSPTGRSRGTGPRATVTGRFLHSRTAPFIVGRGPVPRHASVYRKLAGDRPPRYGNRRVFHNSVGQDQAILTYRGDAVCQPNVWRGPVPRAM